MTEQKEVTVDNVMELFVTRYVHSFKTKQGHIVIFTELPTHATPEIARECETPKSIVNLLGLEDNGPWPVQAFKEEPDTIIGASFPGPYTMAGPCSIVGGPLFDKIIRKMKERGETLPNDKDPKQMVEMVKRLRSVPLEDIVDIVEGFTTPDTPTTKPTRQ